MFFHKTHAVLVYSPLEHQKLLRAVSKITIIYTVGLMREKQFNSIQIYLYSTFLNSVHMVLKHLYRKCISEIAS